MRLRFKAVAAACLVQAAFPGAAAEAARAQRAIVVQPIPAFFISTPRGSNKKASLEIVNRAEKAVELAIAADPGLGKASLEAIEPGRRYRLSLEVPPDAPPGRRKGRLELSTDDPNQPRVYVGVNVFVRERVHTFPEAIDLGTLRARDLARAGPAPNALSQTLMVYQDGGRDFEVSPRGGVAGLDVRAERGPSGDRVQLTLSISRDGIAPGPIEATLVLATNDPAFPEVRVPVRGRILPD